MFRSFFKNCNYNCLWVQYGRRNRKEVSEDILCKITKKKTEYVGITEKIVEGWYL